MSPTMRLLFKAIKMLLVSLYVALLLADSVLKPNCSSAKILLLPTMFTGVEDEQLPPVL